MPGLQGNQGNQGYQGGTGYQGAASTVQGPIGLQGYQGFQGDPGPIGYQGTTGSTGATGPAGSLTTTAGGAYVENTYSVVTSPQDPIFGNTAMLINQNESLVALPTVTAVSRVTGSLTYTATFSAPHNLLPPPDGTGANGSSPRLANKIFSISNAVPAIPASGSVTYVTSVPHSYAVGDYVTVYDIVESGSVGSGGSLTIEGKITSVTPTAGLSGNITNSQPTITVNSVLGFPTVGPFTIAVNPGLTQEVMTVTSVSGNVWTVTRTAGVSATSGTIVVQVGATNNTTFIVANTTAKSYTSGGKAVVNGQKLSFLNFLPTGLPTDAQVLEVPSTTTIKFLNRSYSSTTLTRYGYCVTIPRQYTADVGVLTGLTYPRAILDISGINYIGNPGNIPTFSASSYSQGGISVWGIGPVMQNSMSYSNIAIKDYYIVVNDGTNICLTKPGRALTALVPNDTSKQSNTIVGQYISGSTTGPYTSGTTKFPDGLYIRDMKYTVSTSTQTLYVGKSDISTDMGTSLTLSPSTPLNGSITSGAGTLTVSSASGFPTSGQFAIQIDNEQMLVTDGQGTTTWTVTRGFNYSAAASHTTGATVYLCYQTIAASPIIAGEGVVNAPTIASINGPTPMVKNRLIPQGGSDNHPGSGQGWSIGYWDGPLFMGYKYQGAQTGSLTDIQSVGFVSSPFATSGASGSLRYDILANDVTLGTADSSLPTTIDSTWDVHAGLVIGDLYGDGVNVFPWSASNHNIGIRNSSTTVYPPDPRGPKFVTAGSSIDVTDMGTQIEIASTSAVTLSTSAPIISIPGQATIRGKDALDANATATWVPSNGRTLNIVNTGMYGVTFTSGGGAATTVATNSTGTTATSSIGLAPSGSAVSLGNINSFPATGLFVIQMGSEQMLVTNPRLTPSGTIGFTLVRGYNGTTIPGTTYASGTTITLVGLLPATTTLNVTSATGFPGSGNYTISVNGEQMTVTAGQGTTAWTVTRGANGTTPVYIPPGAPITYSPTTKLSLGATSRTVNTGGCLSLIYNNSLGRWIETGFNAGGL